MNRGQEVTRIKDAHHRAVHALRHSTVTIVTVIIIMYPCVYHFQGSSQIACSNFHVFVSTAACDGVKLWDLRTQKYVKVEYVLCGFESCIHLYSIALIINTIVSIVSYSTTQRLYFPDLYRNSVSTPATQNATSPSHLAEITSRPPQITEK